MRIQSLIAPGNCSLQSYCGEQLLSQERSHGMTTFQKHTVPHKIVFCFGTVKFKFKDSN